MMITINRSQMILNLCSGLMVGMNLAILLRLIELASKKYKKYISIVLQNYLGNFLFFSFSEILISSVSGHFG